MERAATGQLRVVSQWTEGDITITEWSDGSKTLSIPSEKVEAITYQLDRPKAGLGNDDQLYVVAAVRVSLLAHATRSWEIVSRFQEYGDSVWIVDAYIFQQ